MKTRIALVIFAALALYTTGNRAMAATQLGDGSATLRTKFASTVPCPSTGLKGSVYCPKKPTDGSPWAPTHVIRFHVPICAGGKDELANYEWAPASEQAARDLAATCPPPPPAPIPAAPDCVVAFTPWATAASGVQTRTATGVAAVPCTINARPVTAQCAPRAAVVTTQPLPVCGYSYLAFGMCNNGVRTRPYTTTTAAMCAGVPDTCQACSVTDAYTDCIANPNDERFDCDFRGVCTVVRTARDCSALKP